ncbi:MAG TPA: TIGR04190 family B12-binding domain/radical SAM domain protein [Gemmatimonadaceae bacterium]|nr:TIGR04190 family B12-binding domain/radical SAM domain protein [Gemmatimonadaceae bacterium]
MGLFSKDLVLLHPPAVYDFRRSGALFGPISDVIPSTPVFEMYPMGLTSIADHLEHAGFNVTIVNIAYRMLSDPAYDAEAEIAALNPRIFGIDLHWLPHAHGALELARIVKEKHPNTPVIMGGLSSSYFHEELILYPQVDFVMRGDSTEGPMLQLMNALRTGGSLAEIPNLTWKDATGAVTVNPLSNVPHDIDDVSLPNYRYVMRSVFKYGSLANVIPYIDWLSYPITGLLTSRGCTQDCSICGGSRSAYRKIGNRKRPAFRSPEALVRDIRQIHEFSGAPIMLLNDIRQAGRAFTERFFDLLEQDPVPNELIFELFFPADDAFFERVQRASPRYSLEITLESPDEQLRKINGKLACSNAEIEETMASALRHGVNRLDVFFMVGIPRQTYVQAVQAVDYCREILEKFDRDKRLAFFIAPLGPFLDPGSRAFEHPEEFGYRIIHRTLEEHRRALTSPSWKYLLNYETETMSRDDIVDATYETALRLARLKRDYGYMSATDAAELSARIEASRHAIAEVDLILQMPEGREREERLADVRARFRDLPQQTVSVKTELLRWPGPNRFANVFRMGRLGLQLLGTEMYLFSKRVRLKLAGT